MVSIRSLTAAIVAHPHEAGKLCGTARTLRGAHEHRPGRPVIVPARFCGPARSGNGGWTSAGRWPTSSDADHTVAGRPLPLAGGRGVAAPAAAPRRTPATSRAEEPASRRARSAGARDRHGAARDDRDLATSSRSPPTRRRPRRASYPGHTSPPVPHLLLLRHRPRRGRRAADLPRPRSPTPTDGRTASPRPGRPTRAVAEDFHDVRRRAPARVPAGDLGGARLRRRLGRRPRASG